MVNRVSHELLRANQGYTFQQFVLVGQSVQVQESLHHFHDCPVHTQSSHIQQCGFYQCGHELE